MTGTLCAVCRDSVTFGPESHRYFLSAALEKMQRASASDQFAGGRLQCQDRRRYFLRDALEKT
jgi:hypothetical protein